MKGCFVIGPIGSDGTSDRKHSDMLLNAVIKDVLHSKEFDYSVTRADEDADPGMIGDRIISHIINSDLVVADLTGLNPNVFYELGIRHSTERATVHIAKSGTILPFDNVAHRTIFVDLSDWKSIEQARTRLAASVRATQDSSYKVSNPITQANASFAMRQSQDPKDVILAEMRERLAALESPPRIQPRNVGSEFAKSVADRLSEGKLINAIKNYKDRYPEVSLRSAKDFIEAIRDNRLDSAIAIHKSATDSSEDEAERLVRTIAMLVI